jgi:tetratricopeptide (TPR) repeat protein
VLPIAREHALRAVALDDTVSEAHTALGGVLFYFDWNWADAEREITRAIELNPSSAEAHELYGNFLTAVGRHEAAVAELEVATDLNPSSLITQSSFLAALVVGRVYDRAIARARAAIEKNAQNAFVHAWLGMALMMQGDVDAAIPSLERARQLDDNVTTTHFLAMAHAVAGHRGEAERLADALASAADARYTCAYEVGTVYARLGDTDRAFLWMERGFAEQCDCLVWLKTEPWLDPLRVDPRYEALVTRVRFPARRQRP